MYNKIIIDRLNNLTYLSALRNSNATAITKKNPYGDIVKFYAQINKNNVIQAISFKATGCSYFIALSSYFCEIVEGRTIDEALKIKEKDLIAFAELDESKHHIYPIILSTFALLIKKYRKGIENGTIKPCEVSKVTKVEETKKRVSAKKTVDVKEGLGEILVSDTKKVETKSTKAKKVDSTKTTKVTTTTTVTEINTAIAVEEKKSTIAIEKKEKELALKEAKKQAKQEKIEKKAQAKEEKKLAKEAANSKKVIAVEKTKDTKVIETKPVAKVAKEDKKVVATKLEKKEESKKGLTPTSDRLAKITAIKTEQTKTTVDTKVEKKAEAKTTKATKETKPLTKKSKDTKEQVVVEAKKESKPVAKKETKKVSAPKKTEKKETKVKTQALVKVDNDIVVSDSIPVNKEVETQNQIIVEHVETKRRVETIKRGGSTQTIEAKRTDALKLNAEGNNVHKEIHSAANLNDMLSRLNASKTTKVNNLEVRSDMSAKKTVDGKVVDSKSASNSFSSMRDSLQKMRLNNETKALPSTKTTKEETKKEEKKEEPQKKGLFSRLFKK